VLSGALCFALIEFWHTRKTGRSHNSKFPPEYSIVHSLLRKRKGGESDELTKIAKFIAGEIFGTHLTSNSITVTTYMSSSNPLAAYIDPERSPWYLNRFLDELSVLMQDYNLFMSEEGYGGVICKGTQPGHTISGKALFNRHSFED
jgi:hypothetical protein